jgi:hypothetical protein
MRKKKIILARTAGVGLALMLIAYACGCGGGSSPGPAADTTAPTISAASVTPALPTLLAAVGENVAIQATVTDDVGVTSVQATVTKPDSSTATVTMTASGNNYTGTWLTAGEAKGAGSSYTIVVTAKDAANNSRTSSAMTVTVEPPPNPP